MMRLVFVSVLAISGGVISAESASAISPPVAQDDSFSMTEQIPIAGNLFDDNGNGVDSDPDGDRFHIRFVRHERVDGIDSVIDVRMHRVPGDTSGPFDSYISLDVHPNGDFEFSQDPTINRLSAGVNVYGRFTYSITEMPSVDALEQPFGSVVEYGSQVDGIHRVGDVNGDGRDDFAVRYEEVIDSRNRIDRAAVIFSGGRFDSVENFDFSTLNGSNGFRISASGTSSFRTWSVGDLDGDGYADIFVGRGSTTRIRYGAPTHPAMWELSNSTLPGATFTIVDTSPGGLPGAPAFGSGDINGDGFDDLAVMTRRNNETSGTSVYLAILYGTESRWSGEVDLASIDGSNGVLVRHESQSSAAVPRWLDDFNGDGRNDLYYVRLEDDYPSANEGAVYILFGRASDFPTSLTPDDFDGSNGIRIVGGDRTYAVGYYALTAGDINGDGLSDIAFSNYLRSPSEPTRYNVIFGSNSSPIGGQMTVDEALENGGFRFWIEDGFITWPILDGGFTADINGDGFDDLVFSIDTSIADDPTDAVIALLGRDDWSGSFDLLDVPVGTNVAFLGTPRPGETTCPVDRTVAIGDLDGDRFEDFVTSGTTSPNFTRSCVLYGGEQTFGRSLDLSVSQADVSVTLTGTNSPPVATNVEVSTYENSIALGELFNSLNDPDRDDRLSISAIDGARSRVDRWYELPAGGRLQVMSSGDFVFDPDGDFEALRNGESSTQTVAFTLASTDGQSDVGVLTLTVRGRDEITLQPDLFVANALSNLTGNFFADNGNGADTADGELTLTGMVLEGRTYTPGVSYLLQSGTTIRFETNGNFQYTPSSPQTTPGAVAETFTYIVQTPGASARTTATFAVRGISDTRRTVSLDVSGPPGSSVELRHPYHVCRDSCTVEVFDRMPLHFSTSSFRANDGYYATLSDWGGRCEGVELSFCQFPADASYSVSAVFDYTVYGPTTIYSATLPGARSGVIGGDPITVFASVANANRSVARNCSFVGDYEPSLTYRETDAANSAIGDENPFFELEPGTSRSFVLGYSPRVAFTPRAFYPRVVCGNAEAAPVPGVNSILLSASDTPTPDILSIAATPSGDGVIRILSPGGRRFMSAAAVNIGAGDAAPDGVDVAFANEATITVSADTGTTVLPLDVTVCETGSDGRCLQPAGTEVVTQIGDGAKTFAVFVQASSDAGIAFDPANSRVYLRFRDAGGVVRSVTSAAVIAPAPANDFEGAGGFWSLGIVGRDETGTPAHSSAWLLAHSDGRASLIRGEDVTAIRWQIAGVGVRFASADGTLVMEGSLDAGLSLRLRSASGERINGVHSGARRPLLNLGQGHYVLSGSAASTLTVSESGVIGFAGSGCRVAAAPANDRVEASVSGCGQAGRGEIIVFDHADAETGEIVRSLAVITDAGGFAGRVEVAQ